MILIRIILIFFPIMIREPSKEDINIDPDSNINNKINDTSVGKNQFINKKRRGTQTTTYSLRNYEKKRIRKNFL